MPLSLVVGPANGGKVALLLDRYLQALDREPILVVPNRADVERAERDLLTRSPALLGGSIGTFDDLFDGIARGSATGRGATPRPVITRAQRAILLKRLVARARLNGFSVSARFPGFVATLEEAIAEVESALLEPDDLDDGPLTALYADYRAELDRLGLTDRELERRRAGELVAHDLQAWDGRPVFAYGFEDLTGAQWALLATLAGRADVTVSLSYEAGRGAFRSLSGTAADLARLADDRIEELPAGSWAEAPALAHLERRLFEHSPTHSGASPPATSDDAPPLAGAVRFLEAAGSRSALELAGEEILALLRGGVAAEEIAVVSPAVDRLRALLETSFGALGVPYAVEGTIPLGSTPFGRALVALLRFAWLSGTRGQLFVFLRSRYSGLPRQRADFVEGRLRGRAVNEPERVEEEAVRLLGHPIPALAELRGSGRAPEAVRTLADSMLRAAHGLESPPVGGEARLDLRAHEGARKVAAELDDWAARAGGIELDEVVIALERAPVRVGRAREPGRVAVLDLLRARTGSFAAVFVLGLEEGVFPRRAPETPFLREEERRELEAAAKGRRIARPDPLDWDRFLFYSACTRARRRLVLVRQAATDDGRPLEPSPFYEEVRSHFPAEDVERWTRRRSLSELSWELERAPSDRERLRATASLAAADEAEARALAGANGWARRIDRALSAFSRPTRLSNPRVLRQLAEITRFSVTELETFGTCSSMWLLERVVDPKAVDAEVDARMRGAVAHQALFRFYAGLPRRLGSEQVERERLGEALAFLRECLAEAIAGQVRLDLSELDRLELEGTLARDLEHFVRQEVELALPLVPRRFELVFGTPGAPVELQRGLALGDFTVSGKIDRVDLDPFSARGIVHDYKSGSGAHSAAQIEAEGRLQVPLYILALRDLVGVEPLGGLYRALAGSREARGLVRASARADVPGLKRADYVEEEHFWEQIEAAAERARAGVARVRAGDVRHDPRGGECPSWCELWPMCRVRRA